MWLNFALLLDLNRRDLNTLREFVSPTVSGDIFLGGSSFQGNYPDCDEETCGLERVTWSDGSSLDSTLYTGWLGVHINDNQNIGVLRVIHNFNWSFFLLL